MRSFFLFLVLLVMLPAPVGAQSSSGEKAGGSPELDAAEPEAAAVTEKNLMASERFWPYHVALTRAWQPAGREKPLRQGRRGVLIRVESSGVARIDFGRHGRYDVPVGETDLVERANRVRRGELGKMGPNFALAIGNRLFHSHSMHPVGFPAAAERPGFLCVFADPSEEGFAELATRLAFVHDRHGVFTILFPQGDHPDARVSAELRSLSWAAALVYDRLSEPYTRTLIDEETPLPYVMLQTAEGRVLFEGRWEADLFPVLTAVLDEAFADASLPLPVVDPEQKP
jgi:hypothetical protein